MPIIIPAAIAAIATKIGAGGAAKAIAGGKAAKGIGGFLKGIVQGKGAQKIANTARDIGSIAQTVANQKENPVYKSTLPMGPGPWNPGILQPGADPFGPSPNPNQLPGWVVPAGIAVALFLFTRKRR